MMISDFRTLYSSCNKKSYHINWILSIKKLRIINSEIKWSNVKRDKNTKIGGIYSPWEPYLFKYGFICSKFLKINNIFMYFSLLKSRTRI